MCLGFSICIHGTVLGKPRRLVALSIGQQEKEEIEEMEVKMERD